MTAIWSLLMGILSNVLVWAYAAAAIYGSWLLIKYIRGNRELNNFMCQVIVGIALAVGAFISYYIMNWIMTTIVPSQAIADEFSVSLIIIGLLNLITLIVVPIAGFAWIIFGVMYVSSGRCPNCHYTETAILKEAINTVRVKTTKITKYGNGSSDKSVSYQDEHHIDYTMKCPECGHEWHEEGLRIDNRRKG